jgi:hypothetical protein
MKKIVLLALMTVILLTLVSCNTNNETSKTNDLLSDEVVENEIVSEVKSSETTVETVPEETRRKVVAGDIIYTDDAAVFDLENAYYNEAGGIIVEGYIVNVTDHMADNLRVKKLELFNENNELIASNAFGYLEEHYGYVDGGDKFEISFTFPAVNVYIKDDNLDSVESVSSFTSEHW